MIRVNLLNLNVLLSQFPISCSEVLLCEADGREYLFPANFLRKITPDPSGCWIWNGITHFPPRHPQHKYGLFSIVSGDRKTFKQVGAHKFAYERVYGPVPVGLELDHLCHVKLCVNPGHLQAVTHQENCKRRKRSGPLPGYKLVNGKAVRP